MNFLKLKSNFSVGVCVLVILYPSIFLVYPLTVSSSTVYLISFPLSSNFGSSVKLYFQSCSSVVITDVFSSPFANNFTLIAFGLIPSLLLASFHVFTPLTSTVSGFSVVYVFIKSYPFICFVYFSTSLSSIVYFISCLLSSYFASPVKLYFQPSFSLISLASTCVPFANK